MIYLLLMLTIYPPTHLEAKDKPNDAGSGIYLSWSPCKIDSLIDGYIVLRMALPDTVYEKIGSTGRDVSHFEDDGTEDSKKYKYIVAAIKNGELFYSEPSNVVQSYPQVFHVGRLNVLICLLTNFFIGRFWAESLIMAETGAQTGAFQIAGTDSVLQLPFFVTACDYTLIGEELYAASAYLSHEPLLLGSLKAQDYGKLIVLIILFGFTILSFLGLNLLSLLRVQ